MTEENERPGDQLEPEQKELGGEETVGEMLLSAREKKGIALEAISQDTKIPVATLKLLETDNFEALPAKVYATGFLKTYSQVLGLDPTQIINKYEVQTGQTHKSRGDLWEIEEEVIEEKLDSPHLLRKFVIPAILVVVAIMILWRVFGGREEGAEQPPALPEAAQQADAGNSVETVDPAAGRQQDQEPAGGTDDAVEELAVEQPAAPAPEPETASVPPAEGEMSLRIAVEDKIWFDLLVLTRSATGIDTLETDFILEPGESRTFTSNESFIIRKIGKTEGFSLELDGRPYEVPIVEGRLPRDITISRNR